MTTATNHGSLSEEFRLWTAASSSWRTNGRARLAASATENSAMHLLHRRVLPLEEMTEEGVRVRVGRIDGERGAVLRHRVGRRPPVARLEVPRPAQMRHQVRLARARRIGRTARHDRRELLGHFRKRLALAVAEILNPRHRDVFLCLAQLAGLRAQLASELRQHAAGLRDLERLVEAHPRPGVIARLRLHLLDARELADLPFAIARVRHQPDELDHREQQRDHGRAARHPFHDAVAGRRRRVTFH